MQQTDEGGRAKSERPHVYRVSYLMSGATPSEQPDDTHHIHEQTEWPANWTTVEKGLSLEANSSARQKKK